MATEVDKPLKIIVDNRLLVVEALSLLRASRGRVSVKVINPVIKTEFQREVDRINAVIAAVNSL